ncbi:hypothetical protein [Desulfogranum japonicum]|uniref:hypothetical protein n=1 Tax=Desulfogranum japonicum TaxID=231447 RepID=UPI00048D5ECA|nr:hypothetical protein [Desulfogranum japonicum]
MKTNIFLVILLILSNVLWFGSVVYEGVDEGVSLAYLRDSYNRVDNALKQALYIANNNLVGKKLSEVETVIRKDVYGNKPFMKEGCLVAGNLCLKVDDSQRIISVQFE